MSAHTVEVIDDRVYVTGELDGYSASTLDSQLVELDASGTAIDLDLSGSLSSTRDFMR